MRVVAVLAALATAGCGGDADAPAAVVASAYPLAWAAERIAGPELDVVNLTPAGAEPHDLELSPRDAEAVRDAELVIYVNGGFQPAVEDAISERDGVSFDAAQGDRDPHVWLDPARFAEVVRALGRELDRTGRADALARELEALDVSYRETLSRCDRRTVVTVHAAFGHLTRRYSLEQLSLSGLSPESEPGPRELEDLVDAVRASRATTVFAEPLVSDRLARTVAREAGAEIAVLDPLEGLGEESLAAGDDYLSVMRENLAALRVGLGCP